MSLPGIIDLKSGHAFVLVLAIFIFLTSCENEFDMTGEWAEIPVVYCLLNTRDSVQYVRVQRAYLADDPYPCMMMKDSIYYPPEELKVSLLRIEEDEPVGDTIFFHPTSRITKEDGDFTKEGHVIYVSSGSLSGNTMYQLTVENKRTGIIAKSRTTTLGNYNLDYSFLETRYYNRAMYPPEMLDYHSTLNPAFYKMRIVRFLYLEEKDDSVSQKYVDWIPQLQPLTKNNPEDDSLQHQFNDYYYEYLSQQIPIDPGVKRTAVGVDLILLIGNRDVFVYMELAQRPDYYITIFEYSNIENGYGLFSSRYNYTFFAQKLKPETRDSLSWGRFLYYHRFADSEGNWH